MLGVYSLRRTRLSFARCEYINDARVLASQVTYKVKPYIRVQHTIVHFFFPTNQQHVNVYIVLCTQLEEVLIR